MECPDCQSQHIRKNGSRGGKQNHICVDCGRQFVSHPQTQPGYRDDTRLLCLRMYVNGMGFRGRDRVTGIHHTTMLRWVMQVGQQLPDAYKPSEIPEVGELDSLPTFVWSKKKRKSGSGEQLTTFKQVS